MWKLFDWFSGAAPKDTKNEYGQSSPVHAPRPSAAQNHSPEPDSTAQVVASEVPSKLDALLAEADMRSIVKREKPRSDSETRKDGMAYWRMNTRRERPTDAQHYGYMTNSGQVWNPLTVDASASINRNRFDQTISSDLNKLGSMLNNSTRNYLSGAYGNKGQAEIDGRFFESGSKSSTETTGLENYPHYQGEWEPIRQEAREPQTSFTEVSEVSEVSEESEVPAAETASFIAPAAHLSAGLSADQSSASIFEDLEFVRRISEGELDVDTEPVAPSLVPDISATAALLPDELVHSLVSLESSPQCDDLFSESAATYAQTYPQPIQADSQAEQSTTLDRMPSTQFIDVRIAVADNPNTSHEILLELAHDENPDVRFALAENHNANATILSLLSNDGNPFVASRARKTLQRLKGGQFKQGNFGSALDRDRARKTAK